MNIDKTEAIEYLVDIAKLAEKIALAVKSEDFISAANSLESLSAAFNKFNWNYNCVFTVRSQQVQKLLKTRGLV